MAGRRVILSSPKAGLTENLAARGRESFNAAFCVEVRGREITLFTRMRSVTFF